MSTRNLPWELLAAFLAVRRSGSLSGAARTLNLSQPTVRRQIELLEASVGAPLFVRAASGLLPVDESEALLAEAEAMEAAAESFARLASAPANIMQGQVRITCPAMFAVEVLPPVLAKVQELWPSISFDLGVSNKIENILRRDADVAVRLAAPAQGAIVARKVRSITYGFFALPGPVAESASCMDWETLSDSGLLILQERGRSIREGLARIGLPLLRRAALRTDDDLAQLAAIPSGLGVGIVQASIARRYGLVPIFPELTLPQDVWVAMHEDQRRLRRVKAVFDAVADALGR